MPFIVDLCLKKIKNWWAVYLKRFQKISMCDYDKKPQVIICCFPGSVVCCWTLKEVFAPEDELLCYVTTEIGKNGSDLRADQRTRSSKGHTYTAAPWAVWYQRYVQTINTQTATSLWRSQRLLLLKWMTKLAKGARRSHYILEGRIDPIFLTHTGAFS